jgi:hypothetical protein
MYADIQRNLDELKKSQNVRLVADLLIIAPFLLYMSTKSKVSQVDKSVFIAISAATIWYNARNYSEYNKRFS